MITLKNEQELSLNLEHLKKDAQTILGHLGYGDFDLGILLTGNKTIQEYNLKYRDKDKPTDILSFPFHSQLKAGEKIKAESEDEKTRTSVDGLTCTIKIREVDK